MPPKTKFLIIRFSSIGDIILTTPVVRCLKKQFPNAEIHFVTKKNYKSLLENNPYIDQVFLLENSLFDLLKLLKSEDYDFVIDLHNNLRSRIIKSYLRIFSWLNLFQKRAFIKTFSFDKLNFSKWILVKFKKNIMPNVHIVDRYLATISSFGVKNDAAGLDYFIPEKDIFNLNSLPENYQKKYVVYAIGGQHDTKKLPLKKMIELCQTIQKSLILIGGKEDFEQGEKLTAEFQGKKEILNLCGKLNLNQSASVIKQSDLVYTHDTGMMHVAAALKKNIISIWGNTVPALGMYPYQTNFEVIENKDLHCRPCSKIGYDKCPLGHFKCMNDLKF
jgi:ADP-heptose:LPS heptosyltransferase